MQKIRLVMFEPEISQNVGTLIRLTSCLGISLVLIEPFGFIWDNKYLKRSGMDYINKCDLVIYNSWNDYYVASKCRRLIFLAPDAENLHYIFSFSDNDDLILGRESNGFAGLDIANFSEFRVKIPMRSGCRSLNVAVAGSMIVNSALSCLKSWDV